MMALTEIPQLFSGEFDPLIRVRIKVFGKAGQAPMPLAEALACGRDAIYPSIAGRLLGFSREIAASPRS
jgi:hypothetical protein